jgi:hypothetical protein
MRESSVFVIEIFIVNIASLFSVYRAVLLKCRMFWVLAALLLSIVVIKSSLIKGHQHNSGSLVFLFSHRFVGVASLC